MLVLKPKADGTGIETEFSDVKCAKEHRKQFDDLINQFTEVFQEQKGLPPKREDREIQQLPDSPLPNINLYRQSLLEFEEVKRQVQKLLDGLIRPRTLHCRSQIVFVPKKERIT
jgi:hypothetical protein